MLGVSIKKTVESITKKESSPTTVHEPKNNYGAKPKEEIAVENNRSYTLADLRYLWREYATQLPQKEKATSGRMMGMELELIDSTHFLVKADNELVKSTMKKHKKAIEKHLRQGLKNDLVSMDIQIRESSEPTRAYSKNEQYKMMCQRNASLLKMKEAFALELE